MFSISHLHPMLVHFPIAIVFFGFIAEVVYLFIKKDAHLSQIGFYLLVAGTIMAGLALLSGVLFTEEMSGAAGEVQEMHELFAWITVITLIVTSALRLFIFYRDKGNVTLNWLAFALYGLATVSVLITGLYGGTLVYSYMLHI